MYPSGPELHDDSQSKYRIADLSQRSRRELKKICLNTQEVNQMCT